MPIDNCFILKDHTSLVGEYYINKSFSDVIIKKVVPKLSQEPYRQTFTHEQYEIHFIKTENITVFCIAMNDTPKRVCWSCLEDIVNNYTKSSNKVSTMLRNTMMKWNDPESDKISLIKSKVDDIKNVMVKNIDDILKRGETLEDLQVKTEEMASVAHNFNVITRKVKNKMCARVAFLVCLLVCISICALIAVIFLACGFPTFSRCIPQK